jgi:hypothetical protein
LFAIIHTGHKFDSVLGIALTAAMLLVVVSGYTVKYLLTYVSHDMTDKLLLLQTARGDLDSAWGLLENSPPEKWVLPKATLRNATLASVGIDTSSNEPAGTVIHIAESVADLEYSIRLHELFKRWFGRSLKVHIVLSVVFYALLLLHIGAGTISDFGGSDEAICAVARPHNGGGHCGMARDVAFQTCIRSPTTVHQPGAAVVSTCLSK